MCFFPPSWFWSCAARSRQQDFRAIWTGSTLQDHIRGIQTWVLRYSSILSILSELQYIYSRGYFPSFVVQKQKPLNQISLHWYKLLSKTQLRGNISSRSVYVFLNTKVWTLVWSVNIGITKQMKPVVSRLHFQCFMFFFVIINLPLHVLRLHLIFERKILCEK